MKFSVIVAAWNEGSQIASALKRLRHISQQSPIEIILVDGNSNDDTAAQAKDWADQVIVHPETNRGAQFHIGAQRASGDLLFFLRPDAQPPGNWQQALEHFWLATHPARVAATGFTVDYGVSMSFRAASMLSNVSASWTGKVGGDHGLCTTPELYKESGGFPQIPYMEDFAFCERLRSLGKIVILPERIWPAARRMHQAGVLACGANRAWLDLRYKLGASPETLWRSYNK